MSSSRNPLSMRYFSYSSSHLKNTQALGDYKHEQGQKKSQLETLGLQFKQNPKQNPSKIDTNESNDSYLVPLQTPIEPSSSILVGIGCEHHNSSVRVIRALNQGERPLCMVLPTRSGAGRRRRPRLCRHPAAASLLILVAHRTPERERGDEVEWGRVSLCGRSGLTEPSHVNAVGFNQFGTKGISVLSSSLLSSLKSEKIILIQRMCYESSHVFVVRLGQKREI